MKIIYIIIASATKSPVVIKKSLYFMFIFSSLLNTLLKCISYPLYSFYIL